MRPSVALFRVRFRLNKGAFSAAFWVVAAVFCAVVEVLKWRCGGGSTHGRVYLHEPHPLTHDFAAKFLLGVRSEGVHLWAANGGEYPQPSARACGGCSSRLPEYPTIAEVSRCAAAFLHRLF